MGAFMWLLASFLVAPTTALFLPGLVQLGVGLFLIAATWWVPNAKQPITIIVAIVCLIINVMLIVFLFAIGSLSALHHSNVRAKVLTARDPDSPIMVTVEEDSRGVLQNEYAWSATISADGKRPTQYAGWPVHLIGKKTSPTKLVWHNDDPDWVEIRLDNGSWLKLSWDQKAASDARAVSDLHYFLDPKFELTR